MITNFSGDTFVSEPALTPIYDVINEGLPLLNLRFYSEVKEVPPGRLVRIQGDDLEGNHLGLRVSKPDEGVTLFLSGSLAGSVRRDKHIGRETAFDVTDYLELRVTPGPQSMKPDNVFAVYATPIREGEMGYFVRVQLPKDAGFPDVVDFWLHDGLVREGGGSLEYIGYLGVMARRTRL